MKLITAPTIKSKQLLCSPAAKIAPPTIIKIIPRAIIMFKIFIVLCKHMYQTTQKVTAGVSFFEKICAKKEQRGYLCPCKYRDVD